MDGLCRCSLRRAVGRDHSRSICPAAARVRSAASRGMRSRCRRHDGDRVLHPVIDPANCLGCGACVKACPEQPHHDVLGLINGKAVLVGADRLHRSWRVQDVVSLRCDHAGVRHRASRPRHSGAQAEFRVQCPGHLRRRRTRRHGTDQERADCRVNKRSRRSPRPALSAPAPSTC